LSPCASYPDGHTLDNFAFDRLFRRCYVYRFLSDVAPFCYQRGRLTQSLEALFYGGYRRYQHFWLALPGAFLRWASPYNTSASFWVSVVRITSLFCEARALRGQQEPLELASKRLRSCLYACEVGLHTHSSTTTR